MSTLFLLKTYRFRAHELNFTVLHLIWSPVNCRRAHQRVGAPRILTRCNTKTCRLDYCPLIFCHQGWLVFAILFIGYFDATVLPALLCSLVSSIFYIKYLAAKLIGHQFHQPERQPQSASLRDEYPVRKALSRPTNKEKINNCCGLPPFCESSLRGPISNIYSQLFRNFYYFLNRVGLCQAILSCSWEQK